MPQIKDIYKYRFLNGIFIDNNLDYQQINSWQNTFLSSLDDPENSDIIQEMDLCFEYFLAFANHQNQEKWLKRHFPEDFCFKIEHNIFC
jgi:tripartite-type tricarboxylate transporter receptor subunit TctC